MKLKFKNQAFQMDAVNAVVDNTEHLLRHGGSPDQFLK